VRGDIHPFFLVLCTELCDRETDRQVVLVLSLSEFVHRYLRPQLRMRGTREIIYAEIGVAKHVPTEYNLDLVNQTLKEHLRDI
jgi:hypothetical protein